MPLLNTGPSQGFVGGMMNRMHMPEMMQGFQNNRQPNPQPQQGGNLGDAAGAIGAALAHRRQRGRMGPGVNPAAGTPGNAFGRVNMAPPQQGGMPNIVQGPTAPPPQMAPMMGGINPALMGGNTGFTGGMGIMDPNRMSGMQGGLWNAYNQNAMPNTAQEAPGLNRQVMY